jgi:AcrR family transcriptional regulator
MPDAADRALVSVATAYRYFSSADELWWEASSDALLGATFGIDERIEAAGSDPLARLDALQRTVGFRMLEDQVPYRRVTKTALEQWFRQADEPSSERVPVREGRRNEHIRKVVAPLNGQLSTEDVDRIAHALGTVFGTEVMIALTDAVGLDVEDAKQTLLDAGRWLLSGALSELRADAS